MQRALITGAFLAALLVAGVPLGAVAKSGNVGDPTGDPPHGTAVAGDAHGQKLVGAIAIGVIEPTFDDSDGGFYGDGPVFAILRLRKGNQFATFYGEIHAPDLDDVGEIQALLIDELDNEFIPFFFDGASPDTMDIRVKTLEEFGEVQTDSICGAGSIFQLSDITIAVD